MAWTRPDAPRRPGAALRRCGGRPWADPQPPTTLQTSAWARHGGQPPAPGSVAFVRLKIHVQVATTPGCVKTDFAVNFMVSPARVNFR